MSKHRNPTTEDIVTGLLNEIFGDKDSHRDMANELVPKYNDMRSSLTSVLRYLKYYKEQGQL